MPRRISGRPKALELADFAGPVADPAPELILDKDRLARLKLGMLDQDILELRNQIKFREMYRDMIREQHNIK